MGEQTLSRARADSHRAGQILPAADAQAAGDYTALLVLADGTVLRGYGFGAATRTVGEVCFNTGMSGYQETLTDPSYAGQIITFTFPHIGNVGTNAEDVEAKTAAVRGAVLREPITEPSNWRALGPLDRWLAQRGIPGICGVDTRDLTRRIRAAGAPTGVLAHDPKGRFDVDGMLAQARAWPGLEGMDLAREVSTTQAYEWRETRWALKSGYDNLSQPRFRVVAVDYGAKHNILRCLASAGCEVTVVPATASAEDILRRKPDGVFLSNGPGDPAATGVYAVPAIRGVLDAGVPLFGICLGHQLLAQRAQVGAHILGPAEIQQPAGNGGGLARPARHAQPPNARLGREIGQEVGVFEKHADGRHQWRCSIRPTKRANRWWLSWGPGDASGWYCTENAGAPSTAKPSTVWSNSETCVTVTPRGSDCASTVKPWF